MALVSLMASACTSNSSEITPLVTARATANITQFPVIPVPSNVNYMGRGDSSNGNDNFSFYVPPSTDLTKSGRTLFIQLLDQQGWIQCSLTGCDGELAPQPTVPDIEYFGVYQYGHGLNSPLLTMIIGLDDDIRDGQLITISIRNCGKVTETTVILTSSKEGCIILLPAKAQAS